MRTALLRRGGGSVVLLALVTTMTATAASAHPLGNLSVNTYDGVVVHPDRISVDHVEDIAEVPSVIVTQEADRNADGVASQTELDTWAVGRCQQAATRITLSLSGSGGKAVRGTALPLTSSSGTATRGDGQAGLPVVRVTCLLEATVQVANASSLRVDIAPIADIGWREITLNGDRMTLGDSTLPSESVSHRLSAYTGDLTVSPDLTSGSATLSEGGASRPDIIADPAAGSVAALSRGVDSITLWVEDRATGSGPWVIVAAILGGLVLGALHAVAPGHGKTVVAAMALSGRSGQTRRQRYQDAITLGASVTAAHTGSVIAVGATLTVLGAVVPARLFPALAAVSGLLVVGLGIALLRGRLVHSHGPGGHTHDHGNDHDHPHADHDHDHPHHGHDHPHADHDHSNDHDHSGQHGHDHAHDGNQVRGRAILLGVVGGLTPSPTALLLLLAMTAAGRAWLGLLTVTAFGVGMSVTLAGAGLVAVAGGRRGVDFAVRHGLPARWAAAGPKLAGVAVVGAGIMLTLRGALAIAAV